jgi:hypothetical protein
MCSLARLFLFLFLPLSNASSDDKMSNDFLCAPSLMLARESGCAKGTLNSSLIWILEAMDVIKFTHMAKNVKSAR